MKNKIILNQTQSLDTHYYIMLDKLSQGIFNKTLKWSKTKPKILFRANVENMYKTYLNFFKEEERQEYTCNACAHFFKRYADVVYIENGVMRSLYWDESLIEDEFFKNMVRTFRLKVETSGRILCPFAKNPDKISKLDDEEKLISYNTDVYGYPELGGYKHFSMTLVSNGIVYPKKYTSFESSMDYFSRTVFTVKNRWPDYVLNKALNMAKSGDLNNKDSESTLEAFISIRNQLHANTHTLWDLFYKHMDLLDHFVTSVEGSLLDDIKTGYPDDIVIARFNRKMEPDKYMRPTSLPTSKNVEEAEKIIAELGLADSLKRKLCPLDECKTFIWREEPQTEVSSVRTVFGSVKTKDEVNKQLDSYKSIVTKNISFKHFIEKVLPTAKSIRIYCSYTENLFQYLTEGIQNSKPILRYDNIDNRNPISKYTYKNTPKLRDFNINDGYNKVVAIVPECENMNSGSLSDGVLFVLEKCYDIKIFETKGLALFPQILIDELYPVRKVIEEFSNTTQLSEKPDPNIQYAAGLFYVNGSLEDIIVDDGNVLNKYNIVCKE